MYTLCTVPSDSSLHTCYVQIWKIMNMYIHVHTILQMYVHVCTWYVQCMYKALHKHVCTLFRHVCTRLYVYVLILNSMNSHYQINSGSEHSAYPSYWKYSCWWLFSPRQNPSMQQISRTFAGYRQEIQAPWHQHPPIRVRLARNYHSCYLHWSGGHCNQLHFLASTANFHCIFWTSRRLQQRTNGTLPHIRHCRDKLLSCASPSPATLWKDLLVFDEQTPFSHPTGPEPFLGSGGGELLRQDPKTLFGLWWGV